MSKSVPNNQKLCSLCGETWRQGQRPYCESCGLANHLYRKHGTGQIDAMRAIRREVREGRLECPEAYKCVDCDNQATVYEHRDYNRPLDVVPTCRPCNGKRRHAIAKKMTFDEFLAAVRKTWQWATFKLTPEHFEPIRRKYFQEQA